MVMRNSPGTTSHAGLNHPEVAGASECRGKVPSWPDYSHWVQNCTHNSDFMALEEKGVVNHSNQNWFLSRFEVCRLGSPLTSLLIYWSSYLDDGHSENVPKMSSEVRPLLRYF